MNKTEKLICLLIGAVLAWYLFTQSSKRSETERQAAAMRTAAATNAAPVTVSAAPAPAAAQKPAVVPVPEKLHDRFYTLSNAQEVVSFAVNERGVAIKSVTLLGYAQNPGPVSEKNPPVTLDFGDGSRALALGGVTDGDTTPLERRFRVESPTCAVYRTAGLVRRFTLQGGYRIAVEEEFTGAQADAAGTTLCLGAMTMGGSQSDLLSVDSQAQDAGKGKPGVIHHGDDSASPLRPYLAAGYGGGCSCSPSGGAQLLPATSVRFPGVQDWVAVKNRFFVLALSACDQPNRGFEARIERDERKAAYAPKCATVAVEFGNLPARRALTFYAGPKVQSLLADQGMRDVMEFGIWRWICYPLVWTLNFCHRFIPNYGVAIILLTLLVRLLFWPLTRKSTEGMRRMQELQPKMKELREKFKDNPQRMQQETFALYREHKVNPLSSCLPMLIQIPVFIALYNVLRSAVELRYASFLWISDLSEPERLFADWFPFGGLNILPVLMAVTTALQSAFTPSTGDQKQQRMMMVMMPLMMLFMFYSFPSALSLYWFCSNLFSIGQMWWIRRNTASASEPLTPEVIDPPVTRQMRRHQG